ncbi:MAG: M28 family peptidase [Candidatus Aminicenantes bacterium]
MKTIRFIAFISAALILGSLASPGTAQPQSQPQPRPNLMPRTPLPQDILDLLANEISGQLAFNNMVKLAGAPWLRDERELREAFYESETIAALARGYGVPDVRIDRFPRDNTFDYVLEAEFWTLTPEKRLVARLEADPALSAGVPGGLDLEAGLVYIPPLSPEEAKRWAAAGRQERYAGKVALMWSHARQDTAKALDAAGVAGVVSFSSRERYFDPDQVVYSRGSYAGHANLRFGFTVSWRQWSELLEDVESGQPVTVRCAARSTKFPDRFENVVCVIPGSEPDRKGVIFTAHLFEGYTKRGANDNMGGCAVQLEILRALAKLIREGALPQPRRTITFLWPQEISGTFEQIKRTPGLPDRLSVNINMDMVSEGLRKNNAVMTMSECPAHLPSYLDGLADSVMNYVWRTNDIVYLNDSPRGRPGGQYFPRPMWEKNGSRDAFRYFVHEATGGSDHICFNNPAVAVPGIELFTWPDQWYHADTDTPDKGDPTQMKRVAFIGAAAAWAAANCDDQVLPELLRAVSAFGYARVGKRELPRALQMLVEADSAGLQRAFERALDLTAFAVTREAEAVRSVEEVYSGSAAARRDVAAHLDQWKLYGAGLESQVRKSAAARAGELKVKAPTERAVTAEEKRSGSSVPALAPDVKGREFQLESSDRYKKFAEANSEALKALMITPAQRRAVLNYIDGRRTLSTIRSWVEAETGTDLAFADLLSFIHALADISYCNLMD